MLEDLPEKVQVKQKSEWSFRLYVAGQSPHSLAAIARLKHICSQYLEEAMYDIEVIDLLSSPHLAVQDGIVVVPTLVKIKPEPMKRLIGDLSDTARALATLNINF